VLVVVLVVGRTTTVTVPVKLGMSTIDTSSIVVVTWFLPPRTGSLNVWPSATTLPRVAVYGSPPIMAISGMLVVVTWDSVGVAHGVAPWSPSGSMVTPVGQ
jgi:hypothetical protein